MCMRNIQISVINTLHICTLLIIEMNSQIVYLVLINDIIYYFFFFFSLFIAVCHSYRLWLMVSCVKMMPITYILEHHSDKYDTAPVTPTHTNVFRILHNFHLCT